MAKADLQAPEERLASMLAECQTWRAIVANPGAIWSELAVILDAGTVAEGNAAAKIEHGILSELWDDPKHLQRPRAGIRQLENDSWVRSSTTGFGLTAQLYVLLELRIPQSLAHDLSAALLDARRKSYSLQEDLLSLARQNPRLDITSVDFLPAGLSDTTEHTGEDQFAILDFNVSCRGSL